jgi:hypothetical protein
VNAALITGGVRRVHVHGRRVPSGENIADHFQKSWSALRGSNPVNAFFQVGDGARLLVTRVLIRSTGQDSSFTLSVGETGFPECAEAFARDGGSQKNPQRRHSK